MIFKNQFFRKFLEQVHYETFVLLPDFLLENVDMEMRPLVQDNFFSKAGNVFYRRNSLFLLLENINKDQAYGPSENKACHRRNLKKKEKMNIV